HLDYHRDMESYFRAKSALFDNLGPKAVAVVNVDDPYGRRLASACRNASDQAGRRLITFGAGGEATLRATRIDTGDKGCHVTLETDEGAVELESPLMGRINAENMMAAAGAARAMGIAWKTIARGVASVPAVPGRLEPVTVPAVPGRNPQDFRVFVDYAHTDDALRKLLQTVREITTGRVIVVFGCGGDRDRTKRPLMGAHAEELADVVYLTSDNSRGERPESIIGEILAGMKHSTPGGGRVHVETDRRKAIEQAITTARAGDVVVIAGKGHETYQITGDGITRFDDRVAAREVLERTLGS
ncbi:MAG: Mur ligase family protein, partial [Acidobacteriota bacterium]